MRFADEAVEWSLPEACDEVDEHGRPGCGSAWNDYTDADGYAKTRQLFDLDGDGWLDLVTVADTAAAEPPGRTYWTWHPGTGTGFGSAREWRLPAFCDGSDDAGSPICDSLGQYDSDRDGNHRRYSLLDRDADGRPDFVVTSDEARDDTIGRERWFSYPNEGDGFGEAQEWELPAFCGVGPSSEGTPPCAGTYASFEATYTTTDLDGDGRLELVATRDAHSRVGTEIWTWYPLEDDGFGEEREWALPPFCADANEEAACHTQSGRASSDRGEDTYFTSVDIDGDDQLDLVVTFDEPAGDTVGRAEWTVYPGVEDGFGEPRTWTLPAVCDRLDDVDLPLCRDARQISLDVEEGDFLYLDTLDLNGDRALDFVVTADPPSDPEIGRTHWLRAPGGAEGFAEEEAWPLPPICDASTGDGGPACAKPDWGWEDAGFDGTHDLDGDGLVDFVVTSRDADGAVGRRHWELYRGECEE